MQKLFQCRSQESFLDTICHCIEAITPVKQVELWVRDIPFSGYKSVGQPSLNRVFLNTEQMNTLQQHQLLWSNGNHILPSKDAQVDQGLVLAGLFINRTDLYGWLEITFERLHEAKEKNSELSEVINLAGFAYERLVLLSIVNLLTHHTQPEIQEQEDLLTAMSGYVSQLSHQLKNPMTSIRGYSDLLSSGFLGNITEQQSQSLETVIYNLDRVNEGILVPNSVFKLYANRLQKQKQEENIRDLATRVCDSFKRVSSRQQVRVKCDIEPDLNFATDRLYFEEALRGIIKGCMHFMEVNQSCKLQAVKNDLGLLITLSCRMDYFNNSDVIEDFDAEISELLLQGNFTETYALWKKSVLLWEFIGGKICSTKRVNHQMQIRLLLCD
jgi:K+-sensing histidine kinase KdpD